MNTLFAIESNLAGPLFGLVLEAGATHLTSVKFLKNDETEALYSHRADHPMLKIAKEQLSEYFAGTRRLFSIPYELNGTLFQKKVWSLIAEIPYGETMSYGEIAKKAGGANLARAVGGAANRNPVPVIVPCHRVIGGRGELTGFAPGVEVKDFSLIWKNITADLRLVSRSILMTFIK